MENNFKEGCIIMKNLIRAIVLLSIIFAISNCIAKVSKKEKELNAIIAKLKPLHKKMAMPQPGDWLQYNKESGQSFVEYVRSDPVIVTKERKIIYIQPIGDFTEDEWKIVKKTAEFLSIFYGLSVITNKQIPLSAIPEKAKRINWGKEQLLTTYILYDLLKPKRTDSTILLLGITATDLWPGKGWNFVFGQASLRERVGVWSINRNGNPSGGEEAFKLCLLRTIKTASHEAGHMFSIYHCIAYDCGMCGSNSLSESDRHSLAFCPECHAKVIWATNTDIVKRFQKLIKFCKANKLKKETEFYEKELKAIQK